MLFPEFPNTDDDEEEGEERGKKGRGGDLYECLITIFLFLFLLSF